MLNSKNQKVGVIFLIIEIPRSLLKLKFKLDLSTIFEKYSWISGTTYD
jgi:hypothetical protein